MKIDKSWVNLDRRLPEYEKRVDEFLDIAFTCPGVEGTIRCPCSHCHNFYHLTREDVKGHLFYYGMEKTYDPWVHHGESLYSTSSDEDEDEVEDDVVLERRDDAATIEMLYDIQRGENLGSTSFGDGGDWNTKGSEEPNDEAKKFFRLLKDAEKKLYPKCEDFSRLSFIVNIFQIKCSYGWSNTSVDVLLKLLVKSFPKGNTIPDSTYEAKKMFRDLGLDYVKIDACVNDCVLYRNEYAKANQCPVCGESRWKFGNANENTDVNPSISKGKIPCKILRYFPLKSRLQRLFMSSQTAEAMKWHKEKRANDGVLRHPADSLAWKTFDEKHKTFASDPRNVRLGLATDGFNPFGTMSVAHSTWLVLLIPYNLPPWMCMKQSFVMMSMLIPGPKSPGNDIDVYLQPLIEELKDMWEVGIETYDASLKHNFRLQAALLWTINDFPAYANMSGWSTKGALACPCCNKDTCSKRLKHGHKHCYMGHRRFLPLEHPWRKNKGSFDNQKEPRLAPKPLSGDTVLEQYNEFEQVTFGKFTRKRKRYDRCDNWRKKSIFFTLPYWKTLLLRHNLDVMHIEKNICDSVLGTLLKLEGKTKDNLNSRLDLQDMGIRKELHAKRCDKKIILRPARYTLSMDEKQVLCQFLKEVKVPDSYASNITRCVNVKEGKISGLKSHDCHVLLQRLLPLAFRGVLPKDVCDPLVELGLFFEGLCSKVLRVDKLEEMESQIAITLCKLEKIFPPSFFYVMVHLPIHLANEAKIAGPVQYRWMYPIEMYLKKLKGSVGNKAHPGGSIAESYIAEECMTFCSRYLNDVETKLNRPERNFDGGHGESCKGLSVFQQNGRLFGEAQYDELNFSEHMQAHFYVLQNCEEVRPWVDEHMNELRRESLRNLEKRHKEQFSKWFHDRVVQLHNEGNRQVNEQLLSLAQYPDKRVFFYKGYIVNGFRFRTKDAEKNLKTQNCGVVVKGDELTGNVDYHGVITSIIQLQYLGRERVVIFKCDWFEVPKEINTQGRGYKKDDYGFISLNIAHKHFKDEPFILASQAQQVYYVKEIKHPNWHTVMMANPRNFYDMTIKEGNEEDNENTFDVEPYQQNELASAIHELVYTLDADEAMVNLSRDDIEGLSIDANVICTTQDKLEDEDEDEDEDDDDDDDDDDTDTNVDDTSSDDGNMIGDMDDDWL